jgi:hypothetical protein
MATSAQYATTPIVEYAQVSTANTARDGSGTTVLICSGPSSPQGAGVGKRLARVAIKATGSTTAGTIRFFISLDGGTTKRLLTEVPVAAVTASGTVMSWGGIAPDLEGAVLQGQVSSQSCQLYASTNNAETFNITVYSATY